MLEGVSTFHVDMAHKDLYMLSDDDLYSVFKRCRELGALALVHAENGNIIASVSAHTKVQFILLCLLPPMHRALCGTMFSSECK